MFLFYLNKRNVKENIPIKAHLKYEVEDPELPHYPGEEFTLDIHKSKVVESIEHLKKQDINEEDIHNMCESDFPALKVRGRIDTR